MHQFISEGSRNKVVGKEQEDISLAMREKLICLGEMAAGVAHEINNPLTVVLNYLEQLQYMIEEDRFDAVKGKRYVGRSLMATQRINKIVSGLKIFSRNGEKDPFQRLTLKKIFSDIQSVYGDKLALNGIRFKIYCEEEDLELDCQSVQIGQVLINLINNARDAVQELDDKWIALSARSCGDNVIIEVIDSGNGVPEEIQDEILKPFFTTKGVGKGTGLGLSISREIVESHGGRLEVDTKNPQTKFMLTLPKCQGLDFSENIEGSGLGN